MDVKLIHKLNQDNLVMATLSCKEYNEKPSPRLNTHGQSLCVKVTYKEK
jgi:hypothetical protein